MFHDWWIAHRFELYFGLAFWAVLLTGGLIYFAYCWIRGFLKKGRRQ